jgi:hypothetical protein
VAADAEDAVAEEVEEAEEDDSKANATIVARRVIEPPNAGRRKRTRPRGRLPTRREVPRELTPT